MSHASHTSHTHCDAHESRVSPCCTPHTSVCATARLRANNVLHVTVAMGCQLPKSFFNRALKKCRSIDRCPHLRPDNGSLPTPSFSSYPRRHLFWLRPCFFRCSCRGNAALRVFGMGRRYLQPAHSPVALQPCAFTQPRR